MDKRVSISSDKEVQIYVCGHLVASTCKMSAEVNVPIDGTVRIYPRDNKNELVLIQHSDGSWHLLHIMRHEGDLTAEIDPVELNQTLRNPDVDYQIYFKHPNFSAFGSLLEAVTVIATFSTGTILRNTDVWNDRSLVPPLKILELILGEITPEVLLAERKKIDRGE